MIFFNKHGIPTGEIKYTAKRFFSVYVLFWLHQNVNEIAQLKNNLFDTYFPQDAEKRIKYFVSWLKTTTKAWTTEKTLNKTAGL